MDLIFLIGGHFLNFILKIFRTDNRIYQKNKIIIPVGLRKVQFNRNYLWINE